MTPEDRIIELGLTLPTLPPASGQFVHWKRSGNLLYLSGKGPKGEDGTLSKGKLGADVDVGRGYADARLTGLALLAAAKAAVGELSQVGGVVKLLGLVNAVPEFDRHPEVIDGCSSLFIEVFGEAGRHARSAIGVGSLPNNMTVEIEAILDVKS